MFVNIGFAIESRQTSPDIPKIGKLKMVSLTRCRILYIQTNLHKMARRLAHYFRGMNSDWVGLWKHFAHIRLSDPKEQKRVNSLCLISKYNNLCNCQHVVMEGLDPVFSIGKKDFSPTNTSRHYVINCAFILYSPRTCHSAIFLI